MWCHRSNEISIVWTNVHTSSFFHFRLYAIPLSFVSIIIKKIRSLVNIIFAYFLCLSYFFSSIHSLPLSLSAPYIQIIVCCFMLISILMCPFDFIHLLLGLCVCLCFIFCISGSVYSIQWAFAVRPFSIVSECLNRARIFQVCKIVSYFRNCISESIFIFI